MNYTKSILSLFLFLAVLVSSQGQSKFISKKATREVETVEKNIKKVARVLVVKKEIETELDKTYTWYMAGEIASNRGDYQGHLLHGVYKELNLQNKLVCKGTYEQGLKHGLWLYWSLDGQVKKSEYWEEGVLHGTQATYTANGEIQEEIEYKKGIAKIEKVKNDSLPKKKFSWPKWFKRNKTKKDTITNEISLPVEHVRETEAEII